VKHHVPSCRLLLRRVEPFEDIYVDVDLCRVIEGGRNCRVTDSDIKPIFQWIEEEKVSLRVLSPWHYLGLEAKNKLNDDRFVEYCHGSAPSYAHRYLVALACLYFEALGKRATCNEGPCCDYSAGRADAWALGTKCFAECGTLRPDKPSTAMMYGETLLIIPYQKGALIDEKDHERLATPRYDLSLATTDELKRVARLESIRLAFELTPVSEIERPSLFEKNAAKGLI
jgi:hypothetical protein